MGGAAQAVSIPASSHRSFPRLAPARKASTRRRPARKRSKLLLGVSAIYILLAVIAGWFGPPLLRSAFSGGGPNSLGGLFRFFGTPTLTPTETFTQTPSPTWTATFTPNPTSTETSTPAPTETLTPTPTCTPTFTPTETPPPPPPAPTEIDKPKKKKAQPPASPGSTPPKVGPTDRWVDVDLSSQTTFAMQGDQVVSQFVVSTGAWPNLTVTGVYRIYVKYRQANMSGDNYFLPNVPYVMYFYKDYGIHGTYWHNNFGHPMSHGCVNLKIDDAGWLYSWASVGTVVSIHQ
jgi:lipoprotein-anchoring transpeptidase ErfK/SrfK